MCPAQFYSVLGQKWLKFRKAGCSMKISVLVGVLSVALFGLATTQAQAQTNNFSSNASFDVAPSFTAGNAWGSAYGLNAVVTNMGGGITYFVDEGTGDVMIETGWNASGFFGNPASTNPYYDLLVSPGLHTQNNFTLSQVTWHGEDYSFDTLVGLTMYGTGALSRAEDHTSMSGYFYANINGEGAIPIRSSTNVWVITGPHPEGTPDWFVNHSSLWLVTSGMHLVPSPGSAALIGFGGLVASRRRRSSLI